MMFCGLLLAAGLAAQTVHLVGPGGLAEIADAVFLAAPGDQVEVAAGNYQPFSLDKPLSIRAQPGALVTVLTNSFAVARLRPPVGSVATLSGIEFRNPSVLGFGGLVVRVERGTVLCEDCVFESSQSDTGALAVSGARAVLRGCTLIGGVLRNGVGSYNPGLTCLNAQVLASDCSIRGSNTAFDSFGGAGEGVWAAASDVHLVRCSIDGGNQLSCIANPPAAGIVTFGSTRLWLADCAVRGGGNVCGDSSSGLVSGGSQPAQLARNNIAGGIAINGTPGAAISGSTVTAPLLGLGADTAPLALGSSWSNTWRGPAGAAVLVVAATRLQLAANPLVEELVSLPVAEASLQAVIIADAIGDAVYQTSVPASPALRGVSVFFEGLSLATQPVRTSPAAGGVIR